MAELKLNVLVVGFPYGGNGATSSEHPDVKDWLIETVLKAKSDPRVGAFASKDLCDTPITMTRNRAIRIAKQNGYDLLLMYDSDQSPNLHRDEPWFKPFWDTAFDFIYQNYHKGPRLVFAPYCGPPNSGESVYVFNWRTQGNHDSETQFSLEMYPREQAAIMTGVQEAAAGPTGLILIDLRLMELIEPSRLTKRQILENLQAGAMTLDEAMYALRDGYFYYEYKDQRCDEKASTEDVTFTRDIALAGLEKYGYNPVFVSWDSWIGHHKPWNVGRPKRFSTDQVGETLRRAVIANHRSDEVMIDLSDRNQSPDFREFNRKIEQALERFENAPQCPPLEEIHYTDGSVVRNCQTGNWRDHGHAPRDHQRVLQDLIRGIAFKRDEKIRILEVGSWLGSTALAMSEVPTNYCIHCVDTWEGTSSDITGDLAKEAEEELGPDALYNEFCRNVGDKLNTKIFPWRGRSVDMARKHWEPFHLIFIDADHSYEGCAGDILAWWPHLADDGIMVGHDYNVIGHEGVNRAVDDIFGEGAYDTIGWHPQGAMWMVRKKDFPHLSKASNGQPVTA